MVVGVVLVYIFPTALRFVKSRQWIFSIPLLSCKVDKTTRGCLPRCTLWFCPRPTILSQPEGESTCELLQVQRVESGPAHRAPFFSRRFSRLSASYKRRLLVLHPTYPSVIQREACGKVLFFTALTCRTLVYLEASKSSPQPTE